LQQAQHMGVIHAATNCPADAVAQADLVVVAVPVAASEKVFLAIADSLSEHAIVTDVGSTKQNVIEAAETAFGPRIGQFVPAHPIAGKEVAGIAYADADLYRGKQVILTPTRSTRIGEANSRFSQRPAIDMPLTFSYLRFNVRIQRTAKSAAF